MTFAMVTTNCLLGHYFHFSNLFREYAGFFTLGTESSSFSSSHFSRLTCEWSIDLRNGDD
jgi:hypothetical protein